MTEPNRTNPLSPDDALPAVEPPSAGFLVQLFVIPFMIVAILVLGWLFVQWLVQGSNNPHEFVRRLRGNSETRWQAAVNLAGALANPQNESARRDPTLARELSQILLDDIATANMEKQDLLLREYLCLALGHFSNDAGLPALLKAATTSRDAKEDEVRLAAIYGLGELARSMREGDGKLPAHPEVIEVLVDASKSDEPLLRGAAALSLGGWGGEAAVDRLAQLLDDSQPRVRYAAASALARLGDARAIDTIAEMLSPDAPTADISAANIASEAPLPAVDDSTLKLPNLLGLKALTQFLEVNSQTDLSKLVEPVERLTKSPNPEVRSHALAVREALARKSAAH
jgi:HEAT repeat protein